MKEAAIIPLYDLKNAYYEIIRELVLPLGTDREGINDNIDTHGIPKQLMGVDAPAVPSTHD